MPEHKCPLCDSFSSLEFESVLERDFRKCNECSLIFVEPKFLPSVEEEKNRYLKHKNDPAYVSYLKKVLKPLEAFDLKDQKALDFGCGSSSQLTTLLEAQGVIAISYDPLFRPDTSVLSKRYNIITCVEVVEHFHQPLLEFEKLKTMLDENGLLLIRTKLFHSEIDFKTWWYVRDFTHVCFYSKNTFEYIAKKHMLEILEISNEHVLFKNLNA